MNTKVIVEKRHFVHNKIIIGIDPWLLNENNGQSRWKSVEYFYNKYNKPSLRKSLSADWINPSRTLSTCKQSPLCTI